MIFLLQFGISTSKFFKDKKIARARRRVQFVFTSVVNNLQVTIFVTLQYFT